MKIKFYANSDEVKFQLNTGSYETLINEETLKKIYRPSLLKTKKKNTHSIIRNKIKIVGDCYTCVTFMGKNFKIKMTRNESNQELGRYG